MTKSKWSIADINQLRREWGKKTVEEIGRTLRCPRSAFAVTTKASQLKLDRLRVLWKDVDTEILREHWNYLSPAEIGKRLSIVRGEAAVRHRARVIGLPPSTVRKAQIAHAEQQVPTEDLQYMETLRQEVAARKSRIAHLNRCGW